MEATFTSSPPPIGSVQTFLFDKIFEQVSGRIFDFVKNREVAGDAVLLDRPPRSIGSTNPGSVTSAEFIEPFDVTKDRILGVFTDPILEFASRQIAPPFVGAVGPLPLGTPPPTLAVAMPPMWLRDP